MRKSICGVFACAALLCSLIVTAMAGDTAVLTITPDQTQITADGGDIKITYTITVTPPAGKEIGVFSFRLRPSGNMELPDSFKNASGEKEINYEPNDLPYDVSEETGVFRTYEYTPESNFFAAVGSTENQRMTEEARILTITATIPAGSSGVYALDADFTVAPDGSGEAYIGKVVSAPVTVTDPNAKKPSGNVVVTDLDQPASGEKPDQDVTVTTMGKAESTTTWYRDGEKMTDDTFTPGHTYTVVIRVQDSSASFDPQAYANAGYTVKYLSDTELELTRSYYVEEKFTRELTEEEAQAQISVMENAKEEQSEAEPAASEAPDTGKHLVLPLILGGAVLAAGAALVLWKRKKKQS